MSSQQYFSIALELTKKAGTLIRERVFNKDKLADQKTCDIDLVTETDKEVEKFLIGNLLEKYPDHKFIGEESANEKVNLTENPTWIIDPIDGTLNFVHGFPHSCISLALFIEKEPQIAIIYNPILEQLFTAQKNQGAFYNGKQIYVSGQNDLSKALIIYEFGISKDPEKLKIVKENLNTLIDITHGIRSTGSSALSMAMVALGGADAYFDFGTHIWDIAAGELLVTEAGGVIMDPSGGPINRLSRRMLVASSTDLANEMVSKIKQFYPTPTD